MATVVVSCAHNAERAAPHVELPSALPRVDLTRVEARAGFSEPMLEVAGQGQRAVALWLPETAEPPFIVIFLHGAAPRGPATWSGAAQARGLLRCLLVPALSQLHPVLLAPESPDGKWWSRAEVELVLGLARAADARWPSAKHRVVISGYSNGGIGSWVLARLYPDHFVAAVPMAFNDTVIGPTPLPVFAIQSTNDEIFSSERARRALAGQVQRGQDVTLLEKYRGKHLAPCSYVPELASAGDWLARHVFVRAEPPAARRGTQGDAQSSVTRGP